MAKKPEWLEGLSIYAPRDVLPPLPPLNKPIMNKYMARALSINKHGLLKYKRKHGMGGGRRTSLAQILDMELTSGKAARLLGHGPKAIKRWVDQGMPARVPYPGGYLRITVRTILEVRKELQKALARKRKRTKKRQPPKEPRGW